MVTLHMFLLVCTGALVMASAHPFRLNKRQSSEQDTSRCFVESAEEICTSGYSQDLLDLTVRCNQTTTADIISGCSRNANGMLCDAINTDAIREEAQSIGCDFSSTTCTPECRTRLISIRDELDCCFSFFNDSSSDSFDSILFDNTLWTSCGVQGSTEKCTSNTLQLNDIPVDPSCTLVDYLNEAFFSISCRREYLEPLIARVAAIEGCENFIPEEEYETCNTNRFGTHCLSLLEDVVDADFTAANESCSDTSTCDPLCLETLNNISMTSGCCFNEEYNDTNTQPQYRLDWLSYEFYSRCGLESPGLCPLGISIPDEEQPTSDDALSITTSSATIALITLLSFAMY